MSDRPAYTVIQRLSSAIDARLRCAKTNNAEWLERHTETIHAIVKEYLPSGSGIDSGCAVDLERSTRNCVVITTSYHHMNETGYYDGWTEHTIRVRPAFRGVDMTISGPDRNQIKEYLYQTFDLALEAPCEVSYAR